MKSTKGKVKENEDNKSKWRESEKKCNINKGETKENKKRGMKQK